MKFIITLLMSMGFICNTTLKAQCELSINTPTDVVYVKENGSGSGTSWDDALNGRLLAKYIQEKAQDKTVIYVAEGVYYPYNEGCDDASGDIRDYSFNLDKAITMYGGYPDTLTKTNLSVRDIRKFVTRLSGEIQNPDIVTDNSYHVVIIGKDKSPHLNGFYISDGYADISSSGDKGDKINGGGILDLGGDNANVLLSYLVIENNAAEYGGGAYFKDNLATILTNVAFRNNLTTIGFGGAAIFTWGDFGLISSEISSNKNGAAIVSWGGDMSLRNTTVSSNEKEGIYVNPQSSVKVRLIGSTVANNKGIGVKMQNPWDEPYKVTINLDNSLLVNNNNDPDNNSSNNLNLGNGNPIDTLHLRYSIVGNLKYDKDTNDPTSLTVLTSLDNLDDNGGFTKTHALVNDCDNPAINSGDPDLFADNPLNNYDQRGVERNQPYPCIGAYDGVILSGCNNPTNIENPSDSEIQIEKISGFLHIQSTNENPLLKVEIYNLQGQLLKEQYLSGINTSIDISSISQQNMLIIKFETSKEKQVIKL